jgi:hypothetical protein
MSVERASVSIVYHRRAERVLMASMLGSTSVMLILSVVRGLGVSQPYPVFIFLVSAAIVQLFVFLLLRNSSRKALLRAGFQLCPRCAYDLSASGEHGVCPECGREFVRRDVVSAWQKSYRWI